MLVAAGLEGRPSREIADAYEAAFHADAALLNLLPGARVPARHRAHPGDARRSPSGWRTSGTPTSRPPGTCTTRSRPSRATARSRATRSTSCAAGHRGRGRAGQARPCRLRAVEGRGPGVARPALAEPLGRGLPGLAPRVLGDGPAAPRPTFDIHTGGEDNVFPHHEDEIAQSAPIVGGPPAHAVGPRRAPAHERPEDVQVGRQLPADHRARRRGHRPARVPVPVPDRPIRAGSSTSRTSRSRAPPSGLASLRAEVAALGPAPTGGAVGPRRPPCVPAAPPIDPRAGCPGSPVTGRPMAAAGATTGTTADPSLAATGAATAAGEPALTDRAHDPAAPLSAEGRRAARRLRGGHRRRPRHAGRCESRGRHSGSRRSAVGRAPLARARHGLVLGL